MLENLDITKVLFLDIETVPQYAVFSDMPEHWQKLWEKKAMPMAKDATPEELYNRAGIYAEFGKIVCISVGIINKNSSEYTLRLKSFCCEEESEILSDFVNLVDRYFDSSYHTLCAHNGKEFDFPFISRRCLANGIRLPKLLDNAGKKPWEVQLLDTMELWKFGDYKSYTSLNLLAAIFEIPTPKDDIDGSQVWSVYWLDKDMKRISTYCQKDVLTIVQILLKFRNEPLLREDQIIIA